MSCDGMTNPEGHWKSSTVAGIADIGAWQYTQVIEVHDTSDPVLSAETQAPFCLYGDAESTGAVSIPFTLDEPCTPTLGAAYDEYNDGTIDAQLPSASIGGTYPAHVVNGSFPLGNHRVIVSAEDECGNASSLVIPFSVVDCKKPTVVCMAGLSVEISESGTLTLSFSDLLSYSEDNITPSNQLVHAIRRSDSSPIFPVDEANAPITQLEFGCDEVGLAVVELWAKDAAGNAALVRTSVTVG